MSAWSDRTGPSPDGARATRGAAFACWWADRYTRGLDPDVRDARRGEVAADVHDHVAHAGASRDHGVGAAIAWRSLRGVPADLAWRRKERAMSTRDRGPTGWQSWWATATQAWYAPFAVLVGLFDVAVALEVLQDPESTMPGRVVGPVLGLGLAGCLFAGLRLRWRAATASSTRTGSEGRRDDRRRTLGGVIGVAGVVVAGCAAAFGLAVDWRRAVTLVVVLGLALALVLWLWVRAGERPSAATAAAAAPAGESPAARRPGAGLADALVVVGTLPALALLWMVVPPILALVVIGGTLGTAPRARPLPAA